MLDATRLAERLLGDAIYSNMLMLGAAWQAGLVPLCRPGDPAGDRDQRRRRRGQPERLRASAAGRSRIPDEAARLRPPAAPPAEDLDTASIDCRAAHLAAYQDERAGPALPRARSPRRRDRPGLREAVAHGLPQAPGLQGRIRGGPAASAETLRGAVDAQFDGDVRAMRFHLAPPILARHGRRRAARKSANSGPGCSRAFAAARGGSRACAARRSTPSAAPPSGGWSAR